MTDDEHSVTLHRAGAHDAATLANLLELYIHDLSEAFSIDIGPDGRFGYPLARYFEEPEQRSAFLITTGSRLAGFALMQRGSPLHDDPSVLDVAEFFVLRARRRSGVGQRAAFALWNQVPGPWVVRVAETNPGALGFWRAVIAEYTGSAGKERAVLLPNRAWRVFEFTSTR